MAGLSTGAGVPVVKVYHEKSMILPDVSRVLACLYEKDVKFETEKDSYKDILRLQATRSVPVPFYDGPTFLQESRAICRYIAETYEHRGYPFLLGEDVLERASIEQWLRHEEHAFDPPSRALFCHLAFPWHDEGIDDIDIERRKLEEVLEVYEQRLGESEFLAGNKFTLADLVHLPNTHHIVTSEKFAYLYDSRKNVQRWWNTISARDSWQQVVRDMKSVEEQYQMEEPGQQQQQKWETEPLQPSGGRSIHIHPREQAGTESRTILVPPPSDGIISSSFFAVPQEEQPLPAETTSHGEPSPIQRKESNFFTAPEKTPSPSKQRTSNSQKSPSNVQGTTSTFFTPAAPPTTTKKPQRIDTDRSTSEDASSPTRPSQRSSKEGPDKLHISDFYKVSRHTDEAEPITKPTPREASKTSDRISEVRQTGEAVAPDKPSPGSVKAPHEIAPDKPTQKSPSSVQRPNSTFFTTATPPNTIKMPQRTDTDKSTSKDASPPTRPSQGSSREAPDKLHLSDFYKASSHTDEAATLAKPTPQEALKTSDRISVPRQTSEVVAPDKPSPASAKAPHEIDGPDFYETGSKPASVDPWIDNPVPYTRPDSQTPKSPYARPAAQRASDTNGPEARKTSSDQRSVVQTPYAQQPSEQAKKASADQRAAAHLSENVAAKDVQGKTAPQARQRDAKDITKEAREADQKRATSAPTRELPSGSQNTPHQSKAPPTDLKGSDKSLLQAEYEDTQGAMNGDERFSTKRLRKMLEQSDAAALKSQSTDLQAPSKQEETPSINKKPPYVQDRKGQADNISADEKIDGTPSTGTRAPDTPTRADERRATSPPKGGMAPDDRGATEPRKSPSINEQQPAQPVPSQSPITSAWRAPASSNGAAQDDDLDKLSTTDQRRHTSPPPPIQQGAPGGPSINKLDKTAGVDRRAQPSTPKKTSTEQSDKSAMDERAPGMTPKQAPPSDTRHTSASTPPSQEPVSSSQQTNESINGVIPTSHGITRDDSDNIAMADESATPPAPLQAQASDGRSVSTALQGGVRDARGKNEAVKPSFADSRGMPPSPKRTEAPPDTQRRTTSDQASDQDPPYSSFADTRNERTGIAEAGQTTTIAPDEQTGGRAPRNAEAPAAGPLPIKSQENMNEAYSDGASIQQLSSDQSRAQSAENNKKQGGDATLVTESGMSKEEGFLANAKQNNTEQAQATSTDGPSKKQMPSDQNKLISSKEIVQDIGKHTNETAYYRSSATNMPPSVPKKSMSEQQLQGKSSILPQDNGKEGSEAALPVSGTEQPKEGELLRNADRNSGKTPGQALQESEEQAPRDIQQVKNNRSNSKSDGSSKPTQFDGNEGDVPESQRGGSSTNL